MSERVLAMTRYRSRLTVMLAVVVTIATCAASCSSKRDQPPGMDLASMQMSSMQMSVAPAGSCQIDAVKMCQAEGSSTTPSSQPATTSSYGPPNMPESIEFQIPAGQTIKLMCYYNPQHSSIYRADATAQSALTGNSVEYMKKQGFCVSK